MHRILNRCLRASLLAAGLSFANSCGQVGLGDVQECGLCGDFADFLGAIKNNTGNLNALNGWHLVFIEKSSGIARKALIGDGGLFALQQARTDVAQTVIVLSPSYVIQSVLSIPKSQTPFIHQFFKFKSTVLPTFVVKGNIINLEDSHLVTITNDLASAAADTSGFGIPDGFVSISGASLVEPSRINLVQETTKSDMDLDGVYNHEDPDIDGDGIINIIDPDDDNDGVRDVMDSDFDADRILDANQKNDNVFFSQGVEWFSVTVHTKPKESGSGNETSILLKTKVRDNVGPKTVQIAGSNYLLNDAVMKDVKEEPVLDEETGEPMVDEETGEPITETITIENAFDLQLKDDGISEDSLANDRIFARRIHLASSKAPKAHEMIFLQLSFARKGGLYFIDFPYTFPDLVPGDIQLSFSAESRTVIKTGSPFGSNITDYRWSVVVEDEEGTAEHFSEELAGTETSYVIPENAVASGESYKVYILAKTLDRVPGEPAYILESEKTSFTAD